MNPVRIRKGKLSDAKIIAHFNRAMALETESIELIPDVILGGVKALLGNPAQGFYLVAEVDCNIVGSLMITTEWSDWRNGLQWWIQSVYVKPEYRRQGIYRRMYEFVKALAHEEPNVCGFRLYVEGENAAAQRVYESLGMKRTSYLLYEELKPNVEFFRESD